jgi:hypothetical protein
MTPEHDELLCKKYPKIFKDRRGDMTQTAMCWGFEIGDGWFNIINNTCGLIQWHIDQTRKERARLLKKQRNLADGEGMFDWELERLAKPVVRQVVATQIKEKFGTLRFYYNNGDDYIDGVVQMAEQMTSCTCEECGAPGKSNGGGWISVRCNDCRLEQQGFLDDVDDEKDETKQFNDQGATI